MKTQPAFRPALTLLLAFTLLLGLGYPALITALAQAMFPFEANGSIIMENNKAAGSELIGQAFEGPGWFRPRPSATSVHPYNGALSGGSNLGPLNPALQTAAAERAQKLRAENPASTGKVPVDLATASASGLDPHISPAAAFFQVDRVARERGLSREAVQKLVAGSVEGRTFGILGEPRVNVLKLNLSLLRLTPKSPNKGQ
ncbi:MAG: potassium-transporting ATPase subunit KdpC [Deltaproteobacteria bacterium]|nr:potassium-transporting ATPase subunit KdpC [Deltaproteobacteria bacterium]